MVIALPLPIACPESLTAPVAPAPGPNPRPNAPEAVWPEAVALQEPEGTNAKQELAPEVPVGPEAVNCAEPLCLEVVVELELEEQLPVLPLTPD